MRAATNCRVTLTCGEILLRVSRKLTKFSELTEGIAANVNLDNAYIKADLYMRGEPIQNYPCYFIFVAKTFNRYNFDYTIRFVNRFLRSNFSLAFLLIYRLFIRTELFGRKERK